MDVKMLDVESDVKANKINNQALKRIVIVSRDKGEGSDSYIAGWQASLVLAEQLTAVNIELVHLCANLNAVTELAEQVITLDEQQIDFHQQVNIDEASLIKQTKASFVLATQYKGWQSLAHSFFHTATPLGLNFDGIEFQHYLTRLHQQSNSKHALESFSFSATCAQKGKFTHPANDASSIKSSLSYGLNVSTVSYAKQLRIKALALGVIEQVGQIKQINCLDDDSDNKRAGFIKSITLEQGYDIDGDFFIDCTSEHGVLIEQTLGVPFTCWADVFPANSQIEFVIEQVNTELAANTIMTTDFGWFSRKSTQENQYVSCYYDRNDFTPQQVVACFEQQTGIRVQSKIITKPLNTGIRAKQWHKNCLALGKSAVIVEPVSATEFSYIRADLLRWLKRLPNKHCTPSLTNSFNRQSQRRYQDVADFNQTLLLMSAWRTGHYWQQTQQLVVSEQLNHSLRLFKQTGVFPVYEDQTLAKHRWISLLLGVECWPKNYDPLLDKVSLVRIEQRLAKFANFIKQASHQQPRHSHYLQTYSTPCTTENNSAKSTVKGNKMSVENNRIKKVVIVGGGTAGWMTAASMAKLLGRDYCDIRLIESDQIGTVSVGEATIPQISLFNKMLGIDENDFVKKTKGSFKLGIEFIDWTKAGGGYMHPFGDHGTNMDAIQFHHYWLKMHQQGKTPALEEYSLAAVAARQGRFMRSQNMGNSPLSNINYAFHFDATLYAKYLREFAIERGVNRTEGKVVDVSLRSSDGFIDSVLLASGERVAADLFIDCSGFKALLIEGALQTGFIDWSDTLPCDTAVAIPCMPKDAEVLHPFTQAKAQKAGWIWRIPLQHRIGNGYVYPSKYVSDDEAVKILTEQLEGEPIGKPNFLRWTTGIRKKSWNKNCVAIGLAAGFVEPLESTGLHLIQSAIAKLMGLFPHQGFEQIDIDTFNAQTKTELEYIRDFIVLHYKVTDRDDSEFWRNCQSMKVSDRLQAKIDLYQANGRIYRQDGELFNETSWLAVMNGQGLTPRGYHPLVDVFSASEIERRLQHIHAVIQKSAATMPMQKDFIAKNCQA